MRLCLARLLILRGFNEGADFEWIKAHELDKIVSVPSPETNYMKWNNGFLTDITYSSGTIGAVYLSYNQHKRRGNAAAGAPGMTDGTGSQAYAYDDADRLTAKQVTWTGLPAKTVSYGFYPNGSRASMNADGQAFSYSYDAVGRMTGLTNPFSETSAWTYKANSWLATCTRSNSGSGLVVSTAYTYNSLGQMSELLNTSSSGATLSDYKSMVYDAVGNRTSLTASVPGAPASYSGTTSYAYDYGQTANPLLNRSQLTGETSTRGTGTLSYSYDGGTSTGPGNSTSFKGTANSFNADNQQTSFGYDGAGNPTTYKSAVLTFDPENRMTGDSTGSQTDGYNGNGLRIWKLSAGNKTYFLYDGEQPVSEYSGSGTLLAVNTTGASGLVSRHTSAGSTFYTFDERGNISQRLSSIGTVASSDLYDAYGSRTGTAAQADPFGYGAQAGYYTDTETGLVLCTHRYYDPAAGRWLTRDPIGYAGGVNLYGYVGNDPGNQIDPSGYATLNKVGVITHFYIVVNCDGNPSDSYGFWPGDHNGIIDAPGEIKGPGNPTYSKDDHGPDNPSLPVGPGNLGDGTPVLSDSRIEFVIELCKCIKRSQNDVPIYGALPHTYMCLQWAFDIWVCAQRATDQHGKRLGPGF